MQHPHNRKPPEEYYKKNSHLEHPLKLVKFCKGYIEGQCNKGNKCQERHISYKQLRMEIKSIHKPYKQHQCKLFEMKKCPNNAYNCLFAHGENDKWKIFNPTEVKYKEQINQYDERQGKTGKVGNIPGPDKNQFQYKARQNLAQDQIQQQQNLNSLFKTLNLDSNAAGHKRQLNQDKKQVAQAQKQQNSNENQQPSPLKDRSSHSAQNLLIYQPNQPFVSSVGLINTAYSTNQEAFNQIHPQQQLPQPLHNLPQHQQFHPSQNPQIQQLQSHSVNPQLKIQVQQGELFAHQMGQQLQMPSSYQNQLTQQMLNLQLQHQEPRHLAEREEEAKKKNQVQTMMVQHPPSYQLRQEKMLTFPKINQNMRLYCYLTCQSGQNVNPAQALEQALVEKQIQMNYIVIEETKHINHSLFMIKVRTLRQIGLQILRNFSSFVSRNIGFRFLFNYDQESKINFSKPIYPLRILSQNSFIGQDTNQYYISQSLVEQQENEDIEFKLYNFRTLNKNLRILEETITGFLNKQNYENQQFWQNNPIAGRIFIGVADKSRELEGICITNNISETFFTILMRTLQNIQVNKLVSRLQFNVVVPNENYTEFYPTNCHFFIIEIAKPEFMQLYRSSSGAYFQRVEEGVWPMQCSLLYKKFQQKCISEENFINALQQYDRRYLNLISKKIEDDYDDEKDEEENINI